MITIEVKHEYKGEGGSIVSKKIYELLKKQCLVLLANEDEGYINGNEKKERYLKRIKKEGCNILIIDYDTKKEIK